MPRVARYEARCPRCEVLRSASYDPRKHDWAQTCGAPASGEEGCGAVLAWEPVYARPPKTGKARDSQRSKVYRAETIVTTHVYDRPLDDDWRGHVRRILASAGVDPGSVDLHNGSGRRRAAASGVSVSLPRWARTVAVACHEVAHVAAARDPRFRDPGHGEKWCAIYLALVRAHLGPDAHSALHASFTSARVRVDWDLARREVEAIRERTGAR